MSDENFIATPETTSSVFTGIDDEIDITNNHEEEIVLDEVATPDKDVEKNINSNVKLHTVRKQILFELDDISDIQVENIALPQVSKKETEQFINDLPPHLQVVTDKMDEWGETIFDSKLMHTSFGMYENFFNVENSKLTNHPVINGVPLAAGRDRGKKDDSTEMEGPRALAMVVEALGYGTFIQLPMWNSGFSLKFRGWNDVEIAAFTTLLDNAKSNFGRATYGLSFGSSGILNEYQAVDFALDHVVSSTAYFGTDKVQLKKNLSCLDINNIIVGLLAASYPTGFTYSIPCTAGLDKCNRVNTGLINISKAVFADESKLNNTQLEHLAKRKDGVHSADSIKFYKDTLTQQGTTITYKRKDVPVVKFEIIAPSIETYFSAAFEWMDRVTKMVEGISTKDTSAKEKEKMYERMSASITMRQYRHWIASITIVDGNKKISEAKTIDTVCEQLSTDVAMVNFLVEEVNKLISAAAVSAVGIDVYQCNCGHKESGNEKQIIPIDVMYGFFALTRARMSRMLATRT